MTYEQNNQRAATNSDRPNEIICELNGAVGSLGFYSDEQIVDAVKNAQDEIGAGAELTVKRSH